MSEGLVSGASAFGYRRKSSFLVFNFLFILQSESSIINIYQCSMILPSAIRSQEHGTSPVLYVRVLSFFPKKNYGINTFLGRELIPCFLHIPYKKVLGATVDSHQMVIRYHSTENTTIVPHSKCCLFSFKRKELL